MKKTLKYIKQEDQKSYDKYGKITVALEKTYFHFVCHEPDAECQLTPVVCRIHDKMHPENEAVWESKETFCGQCFGNNSRLLEDIYRP